MQFKTERTRGYLLLSVIVVLLLALTAACNTTTEDHSEHTDEHDSEDMGDMENGEHEDEHTHEEETLNRVPNEGAFIRIVSPEDGATISGGEVVIEVEVLNFELGEDGNHWHVYVDGTSHGMVMGGDTNEAVRALEPGEHLIEAYLAYGSHEELEDGAAVTVTITE